MIRSVIGVSIPGNVPQSIEVYQIDQWDPGTACIKTIGMGGVVGVTYIDKTVARQAVMNDVNKHGMSIIKCMYTEIFDIKDGKKAVNQVIDQRRGVVLYAK